jgi:hypothetical protein
MASDLGPPPPYQEPPPPYKERRAVRFINYMERTVSVCIADMQLPLDRCTFVYCRQNHGVTVTNKDNEELWCGILREIGMSWERIPPGNAIALRGFDISNQLAYNIQDIIIPSNK